MGLNRMKTTMIESPFGPYKTLYDSLISKVNLSVIDFGFDPNDKTTLTDSIDRAKSFLLNRNYGTLEIPVVAQLSEYPVYLDVIRGDSTYQLRCRCWMNKYPTGESRPTGDAFAIGDIVYNTEPTSGSAVAWVLTRDRGWAPTSYLTKWQSELEVMNDLPEPSSMQLGRQLLIESSKGSAMYTCLRDTAESYKWVNTGVPTEEFSKFMKGLELDQTLSYRGRQVVCTNSLEGRVSDMTVEGCTLQNLFTNDISKLQLLNTTMNNQHQLVMNAVPGAYCTIRESDNLLYKPNTKYTIVVDIISNTLVPTPNSSPESCSLTIRGEEGSSVFSTSESTTTSMLNNYTGRIVSKLTTLSDYSGLQYYTGPVISLSNKFDRGSLSLVVSVFEGDPEEIPMYFSDICSVGEYERNLLDPSKITLGFLEAGTTYIVPHDDDGTRTAVIDCEPDTVYTIAKEYRTSRFSVGATPTLPRDGVKVTNLVNYSDDNITSSIVGGDLVTVRTPKDSKYLLVYLTVNTNSQPCGRVSICKGTNPCDWRNEPYKCKLNLLSRTKNILDTKQDPLFNHDSKVTPTDTGILVSNTSLSSTWCYVGYLVYVQPNTDYTLSFVSDNSNAFASIRSIGDELIKNIGGTSGSFNSGNNTKVIVRFHSVTDSSPSSIRSIPYSNVQLVAGTHIVPYTPPDSDERYVYIDESLRAVSDSKDHLKVTHHGPVITRRVGTYYTDTNSGWSRSQLPTETLTIGFKLSSSTIKNLKSHSLGLSNKLPYVSPDTFNSIDYPSFTMTDTLLVRLPKRLLSSESLEGLNEWLISNPLLVYYELSESYTEAWKYIVDLDLVTRNMYNEILQSTTVQGDLSFKVPSNLGTMIQSVNSKVNELQQLIYNVILPVLHK